jgi:hypothetical protein
MKHRALILAAASAFAVQQPVQAQSLADRLMSLGSAVQSATGKRLPALGGSDRSTSTSPDDPVFGKARVEARAHPQYPSEEWPDKMVEGYIARDRYGCPAVFANGRHMFVWSFDKFEEKVDGAWVTLEVKKLAKEVPVHCTGGGG